MFQFQRINSFLFLAVIPILALGLLVSLVRSRPPRTEVTGSAFGVAQAFLLQLVLPEVGTSSLSSHTSFGKRYRFLRKGKWINIENPQVPVGGASLSCFSTGTTSPVSGAWEVCNSDGKIVDTGCSPGGNGANSLFNVGPPAMAGGPVNVKALVGAAVATGYIFRSNCTSGPSSGAFDVVARVPSTTLIVGRTERIGITYSPRLRRHCFYPVPWPPVHLPAFHSAGFFLHGQWSRAGRSQ